MPRLRDMLGEQEVPLNSSQALWQRRQAETATLRTSVKRLSARNHESCVEPMGETFGLRASSLSHRFKRASAEASPVTGGPPLGPRRCGDCPGRQDVWRRRDADGPGGYRQHIA